MNDRTPYVTSIAFFLAGGLAGAAAALLFAPQSGRDTRDTVARKVGDTSDSAREMRDRVVQKGGEIWGEAQQRVTSAAAVLAGEDGHKRKADRSTSV